MIVYVACRHGRHVAPAIDGDISEEGQFTLALDLLEDPPRDSTRGIAVAEILIKSGLKKDISLFLFKVNSFYYFDLLLL